jgi:drug/metabolite transporter (DMT)-like permease
MNTDFYATYAGELAATGTLICWAFGSHCFEAAGRRVGSMSVNMLRLFIAFFMFCIALWARGMQPIPFEFSATAWFWLALSGVIGLSIGDIFLFRAFVEIGPRLTLLIMSLNAPFSAMLGWWFLGEQYGPWQWLGMVVTLVGIGWVILERPPEEETLPDAAPPPVTRARLVRKLSLRGILLAFAGTVGQSIGSAMSKHGMGDYDAFAATQIRVIGGIVGLALLFCVLRRWKITFRALGDRRAVMWMTFGAFLGPFLGVGLYLQAMKHTEIGVVATIVALLPIVVIPLSMAIHKEHVSPRAVAGAVIAFCGVLMLVTH